MKNFNKFYIIAHRGCSSQYPENTIESYEKALEIDENCMLEMDVWRTSDGAVVVMHDELLEVRTNGNGSVTRVTLDELEKLDAGYNFSSDNGKTFPFRGKGYKIPLFNDVLRKFPKNIFSVDIKYNSIPFARDVINLIKKNNSAERIVIGSFHNKIIKWIRHNHPDIITAFSKKEILRFLIFQRLKLLKFFMQKDRILSLPEVLSNSMINNFRIVTKKFVMEANKKNIPLYIWTVNEKEDMKRLIEWGVAGIITDYPDKLKEVLSENL